MIKELIQTIETLQKEARDGMKRASGDSDPYLYQYMVGKFHAFGKVAGILKKQKECVADSSKTSADEDERIRKWIHKYIAVRLDDAGEFIGEYREALAWLEKQKEQKPAEWSEEDEKMAYFVNQFLEYHELSDPTAKSCKKWFENRFKSLRPSWKPSEEQMKALLGAEGISRASGYPDNAKVLASLYEELKEL